MIPIITHMFGYRNKPVSWSTSEGKTLFEAQLASCCGEQAKWDKAVVEFEDPSRAFTLAGEVGDGGPSKESISRVRGQKLKGMTDDASRALVRDHSSLWDKSLFQNGGVEMRGPKNTDYCRAFKLLSPHARDTPL